MPLITTLQEIEKEYWETFEINQGSGRINGYPIKNVGDGYSRPATVEDFQDFLTQSHIRLLESLREELPKEKSGAPDYVVDYPQGYEEGHNNLLSTINQLLDNAIKSIKI